MKPLAAFPAAQRRDIRLVLTDIDDTLTRDGRLPALAYRALERLDQAGLVVLPVTGRPAGWCDLIARHWPVAGVVGENGAFYFRYDAAGRRMIRRYWKSLGERAADRRRLDALGETIVAAVPGAAVAADQFCRAADLAIDVCEDVAPLGPAAIDRILALFAAAGATAKLSSIHVNGWFGRYDKLAMVRLFAAEVLGLDLDAARERVVFIGDSPNDAPLFGYFPHSVGVVGVRDFQDRLTHRPAWITEGGGGDGFAELADALLAVRD